jgi:virulence factor Mce-like protein
MIDPREYISEGLTRERLRMEAKRAARPTVVLIAGLALAFVIFAYLLTHISKTFGSSTYEVRLASNSAFGIFEGFDAVRFRGVEAGTIAKIERRGDQIVLVAKIKKKYGPVYKNARAALRPITPLNDMYLDIVDPGTPAAGKADPNVPLPASQTSNMVTVPDVLDTLGTDQRVAANQLLDQLGNGMADGGVRLRRAFVAVTPFLQQAGELTRQIAVREGATKRLISNTAILTTELGRRERILKRLVASGAATLGTLQQGSGDLDDTLAQLGPTFTELRASLAAVRGAVDDIDAGVKGLYPVAERLPQSLASVRRLTADLDPALRKLKPAIIPVRSWVVALNIILRAGGPAADSVQAQVPVISRLTQRLIDCEKGVIGFFQWNASLSKYGDLTAPIPRGNLAIGVPDAGVPGAPTRQPEKACTPGFPPRGIPTQEDLH